MSFTRRNSNLHGNSPPKKMQTNVLSSRNNDKKKGEIKTFQFAFLWDLELNMTFVLHFIYWVLSYLPSYSIYYYLFKHSRIQIPQENYFVFKNLSLFNTQKHENNLKETGLKSPLKYRNKLRNIFDISSGLDFVKHWPV